MDTTGLIGDTLVFMYAVDVEIEKKNYGEMEPYSCPESIREIIREVKAGNTYVYDEWIDKHFESIFSQSILVIAAFLLSIIGKQNRKD